MTNPSDHMFWLLLLSVLCTGVSVALSYIPRWESVLAALGALVLGSLSGYVALGGTTLWFWAAATAIVAAISLMLPPHVRKSRVGIPYLASGALVGAFLGMLLNSVAGVITASAAGVALASVAYSRTPAGAVLGFPSRQACNYLCAKGLPLVVIYSMLGILCMQLIVIGASL